MAITTSTAIFVWTRDKYRCRGCNTLLVLDAKTFLQKGELHHVYFRSQYKKKDRDDARNLALLCVGCHTGPNGVHNGNKTLDRKLKDCADLLKPVEIRETETTDDWRPYQTEAQKLKNRELGRMQRKKQMDSFKAKNNGLSPSQVAYRKHKEKMLLFKKSAKNG